jgi:hypothetical protein
MVEALLDFGRVRHPHNGCEIVFFMMSDPSRGITST